MRIVFREKERPDSDGHRYVFALEDPALGWGGDEEYAALMAPIRTWCETQFGRQDRMIDSRWWAGRSHVWFADRDDAMLFRLRWC